MPDQPLLELSGVPETLLYTVYIRAIESQRPDALLKDDIAVSLVDRFKDDFARARNLPMDKDDQLGVILRNRQVDRRVRDFLSRNPGATVLHFGCGLDGRFELVDDGKVEWYDLDLPEVIELRLKYIHGKEGRYHLLSGSIFENTWMDAIPAQKRSPILFASEGVLVYFPEEQVKSLVLNLRNHFPGTELVIDTQSKYIVTMNNLRFKLSRFKPSARFQWGFSRGKDIESWGAGIRLLHGCHIFDESEPRLNHIRWMRHIPLFANVMGVFHYSLG